MSKLRLHLFCLLLLAISSFSQSRPRTDHWQLRNQQFNHEQDTLPQDPIVFLGNSIIEGFNLERAYPELNIINRGIVGDHLDGLLERLDNSAVGLRPRKIFIMIGINDIGDKRDDTYLREMFSTLVDTLTSELPKTKVYVHSILPTSARWKNCLPDQIRRINDFLEILALDAGIVFVDLHPLFLDQSGEFLNPELTSDGLHLNAQGYELWVKQIKSFVY